MAIFKGANNCILSLSFRLDPLYCMFYFKEDNKPPVKLFKISAYPFQNHEENLCVFPPRVISELISELKTWFERPMNPLPIDNLDMSCLSPFATKILCELRKHVLPGKTISYKELASLAGYPNAARAVGNVMRQNPFPLFFPCHRVVKTNGCIGGFSCGEGIKRLLLEKEQKFFDIKSNLA